MNREKLVKELKKEMWEEVQSIILIHFGGYEFIRIKVDTDKLDDVLSGKVEDYYIDDIVEPYFFSSHQWDDIDKSSTFEIFSFMQEEDGDEVDPSSYLFQDFFEKIEDEVDENIQRLFHSLQAV